MKINGNSLKQMKRKLLKRKNNNNNKTNEIENGVKVNLPTATITNANKQTK